MALWTMCGDQGKRRQHWENSPNAWYNRMDLNLNPVLPTWTRQPDWSPGVDFSEADLHTRGAFLQWNTHAS